MLDCINQMSVLINREVDHIVDTLVGFISTLNARMHQPNDRTHHDDARFHQPNGCSHRRAFAVSTGSFTSTPGCNDAITHRLHHRRAWPFYRTLDRVDPSYRPPRLHRQTHSHRRPSVSTPSFVSTSALSVTSTHCFVSTLDALHHCHCRAHSHPRSFTYHIGACLHRRHACSSHRQ